MYHLIDCQDLNQIQDLLLMLNSIVKASPNSLISYMKSSEIYITLHILLVSDDISTVKSTLSVIFSDIYGRFGQFMEQLFRTKKKFLIF